MENEPKLEINNNPDLEDIFNKDQEDREHFDWENPSQKDEEELQIKDRERMILVRKIIEEGKLQTAEDYYRAAMIFQHGEKPGDYLKANELAKKAVELGNLQAPLLIASSWDRYLVRTNQPFQKYGTQYKRNGDKIEFYPIDPNTTDEERAKFGVPPLEKLK